MRIIKNLLFDEENSIGDIIVNFYIHNITHKNLFLTYSNNSLF